MTGLAPSGLPEAVACENFFRPLCVVIRVFSLFRVNSLGKCFYHFDSTVYIF
jgi:hypothetical protein